MIHHVQRKRIHNAAAINKGMKHWSKVLFIWRLHAADVCSSLPPPPLFLSLLTTFSQTGHIATAHYSVKRCVYVTTLWIHGAQRWFKGQIHPVCPLQQRNVGVPLLLNLAETLRVQSSEVFFFFFSSSPRRCQPRYPREHRPQTQRGFFPQYLRNPWPLANGEAPSFCRSNRPSVSSLLPSFGGFSGFKFTVKPDMLRPSRSRSEAKTLSGSAVFFICVCYAIMCDLVESSLELCLFC